MSSDAPQSQHFQFAWGEQGKVGVHRKPLAVALAVQVIAVVGALRAE